jgi:hypothetical protein
VTSCSEKPGKPVRHDERSRTTGTAGFTLGITQIRRSEPLRGCDISGCRPVFVIPVKTGIQMNRLERNKMDSCLRRNDILMLRRFITFGTASPGFQPTALSFEDYAFADASVDADFNRFGK